jgi:hypothetical protein
LLERNVRREEIRERHEHVCPLDQGQRVSALLRGNPQLRISAHRGRRFSLIVDGISG